MWDLVDLLRGGAMMSVGIDSWAMISLETGANGVLEEGISETKESWSWLGVEAIVGNVISVSVSRWTIGVESWIGEESSYSKCSVVSNIGSGSQPKTVLGIYLNRSRGKGKDCFIKNIPWNEGGIGVNI